MGLCRGSCHALRPTRLMDPAPQPRLLHYRNGYTHASTATVAPLAPPWRLRSGLPSRRSCSPATKPATLVDPTLQLTQTTGSTMAGTTRYQACQKDGSFLDGYAPAQWHSHAGGFAQEDARSSHPFAGYMYVSCSRPAPLAQLW
jgi:hypothetical protein